jgi:hypothetical protein
MTQYSNDGLWWWDGHRWQDVPQKPQPQAQKAPPSSSTVSLQTPARRKRRHGVWIVAASAGLISVLVAASIAFTVAGRTRSTAAASRGPAAPAPSAMAASKPVDSPKVAVSPGPQFAHFSNGIFQVGTDVLPGTYRMRNGSGGCYFARLKSFGGSLDDILANDSPNGPAVVTILARDRGFQSDNCATWTADLSPVVRDGSFGPGDYIVGTDLKPGTYRNRGGSQGCYYARLRGFTHALSDVISNNNTDGSAIVTVGASDKGFASTGCGTWTRVG